jgi:ribosomal protein S18
MIKRRQNQPKYFDYKDEKLLRRYTDSYGQIETRAKTGLNSKMQRQLSVAVKRARHIALLPFVAG